MKELRDILTRFAAIRASRGAAALATVISVSGSTYRRPGARMLIGGLGDVTGCVSGGCLEKSVRDHARRVLSTGMPRVVSYDSTADDEASTAFGLGCDGTVDVLIEPVTNLHDAGLSLIERCFARREPLAVATVVRSAHADIALGARAARFSIGPSENHGLPLPVAAEMDGTLGEVLNGRVAASTLSVPVLSQSCYGSLFVERIEPPLSVTVFGIGHDAVPLIRLAAEMGWHVTAVDARPGNLSRAASLPIDRIIADRADSLAVHAALDQCSGGAAVVMNHHYETDVAALRALLNSRVAYIGVLGPRSRTERLFAELGLSLRDAGPRVHAPIGLDIGADSPEEIALAVTAEIVARVRAAAAGFLRDRSGPLHARPPAAAKSPVRSVHHAACTVGS